jgi:hypothetical protein
VLDESLSTLRQRATFVSSLERGTEKSHYCLVVPERTPVSVRDTRNITMKTKQRENHFRSRLRKIFRPSARRHDPMLVFNMSIFNFTDGSSRTFSKYEHARFYA